MTERLIVVPDIRRTFFDRLFKTQCAGADGYAIAVLEQVFELRIAVYEDFVGTTTELAIDHDSGYP